MIPQLVFSGRVFQLFLNNLQVSTEIDNLRLQLFPRRLDLFLILSQSSLRPTCAGLEQNNAIASSKKAFKNPKNSRKRFGHKPLTTRPILQLDSMPDQDCSSSQFLQGAPRPADWRFG